MTTRGQDRTAQADNYPWLAIIVGVTFVVIAVGTLLLWAWVRGRSDIDIFVFALGVAAGGANLAGWMMTATWGFLARNRPTSASPLAYASVCAALTLLLAGAGLVLNLTGDGPMRVTVVLAAMLVWAICAGLTSLGVRGGVADGLPG